VRGELITVLHQLATGHSHNELLSDYVETALHEIYVAQYLEMHGTWPDGVAALNEHGEFTSDSHHGQTAHGQTAHGY